MVVVNGCLYILDFSFRVLVRYRVESLKRSFIFTRQFSTKQLYFNHQANYFPWLVSSPSEEVATEQKL